MTSPTTIPVQPSDFQHAPAQFRLKIASSLGFDIYQGKIKPIQRAIEFASKFPDEIKDKNQLQRFLGSLNYVAEFYPNLRILIKPLLQMLKKNPVPWSNEHTQFVK